MPDQKLAVGIIGMGGMGTRHALNLYQYTGLAQVVAVYDLDRERAKQVSGRCGFPRVFDDPLALIGDSQVDAVIIASPDPTHAEYLLECIRRNKPVLCEKPLATSAEEASKIVEAEIAHGKRLVTVGFMRRFDPYHLALRRVLESGALGRPLLYKGVHRNMMIPEEIPGEDNLLNSASHDIDMARWLLRQEVQEVYVQGLVAQSSSGLETTRDSGLFVLQLKFSGNCLATVELFVRAQYGYEVSAEIVGERGTALTSQPDYVTTRYQQNRKTAVAAEWLERFDEAYLAELHDWVSSLQVQKGGNEKAAQPFAKGATSWDGYRGLLVSEACIRSYRSGKPVIVDSPSSTPDLFVSDYK